MDSASERINQRAILDAQFVEKILENLKLRNRSRILDIGCGCGIVTQYLYNYNKSFDVVGVDIDKESIVYAKQHNDNNIRYECCDIKKMKTDELYDLCFARMLFEMEEDVENVIKNVMHLLKNDGNFVIYGNITTTPQIYPYGEEYKKYISSEQRILNITKNRHNSLEKVVYYLKKSEFKDIKVFPIYRDEFNYGRENLINYYYEKHDYERNPLVRTKLMTSLELRKYDEELLNLMNNDAYYYYLQYVVYARK